jgi:hypothetical protein
MEEVLMALEAKDREITEFLKGNAEEREHLIVRLNDLDEQRQRAEEDLRRVRRAREALATPSDEMSACVPVSAESFGLQNPLPASARLPKGAYAPGWAR